MATTIDKHADNDAATQKLGELIRDIQIAMLTTIDEEGTLRSRPMATQSTDFDGDLWFFTYAASGKSHEIAENQRVNLSYAKPEDNRYVSVSGTARIVYDRDKAEQLWQPTMKAWFPNGVNDPNLALLRVHVERAEYWDSPASAVVKLVGFVKAVATGEVAQVGENREIRFDG